MKKKDTYLAVGISAEVGKTIASAILTEALEADYWKPIQSSGLENSNADRVYRLISNTRTVFYPDSYVLHTPASPHLSAELNGIRIELSKIVRSEIDNHLVTEAAGELFVSLNEDDTILDLFRPTDKIIPVSRRYLGSINHTSLTCEAPEHRDLDVYGIVFSGTPNPSTESFTLHKTQLLVLLHIDEEPYLDKDVITEYAGKFGN